MTHLDHGTWVVVTDSEKALFLENVTDHSDPNLDVFDETTQDNPSDRAQSATSM